MNLDLNAKRFKALVFGAAVGLAVLGAKPAQADFILPLGCRMTYPTTLS